ncbi:PAS-domain containing protein [Novosphingobium profundi]|uniref:sensor histidine kinase n=1 Tax=Novosphingobium profundi TaxID=1774954 RepID=UPI001BDB12B6|nr:PAS-domain containing protein [Novosphingobium profundi]
MSRVRSRAVHAVACFVMLLALASAIGLLRAGHPMLALGLGMTLASLAIMVWQVEARASFASEARANAALLRATLDNVDHGIALIDAEGGLLAWNARLASLLGVIPEPGMPIHAMIEQAPGWAGELEEVRAVRSRNPLRLERALPLSERFVEVRGAPVEDGLYALTYTDITERRAQERLTSDFISSVSHELRTPLTSIRGALGLMQAAGEELPPRVASLAALAGRNAERLLTLVNDLLDVEKIESGRLDFDFAPVDLNAIALEAAEVNAAYAQRRGVTLTLGREVRPVMVRADAGRLQQVMANLISNAAKFSPQGGIVTITVELRLGEALITVHDHGEGVPEAFRSRIFGKFAQAASGDQRQTGGSGLGLNISRAIVERHGGTIGFTSEPGNTSFRVVLPIMAAASQAA